MFTYTFHFLKKEKKKKCKLWLFKTFQIFSWDGGTLTHQLDLNLTLEMYLFVCFFPLPTHVAFP